MNNEKQNFTVLTWTVNDGNDSFYHWADGLKMVITKGNTVMELNSEEIQKLVNSLPRTVGGQY